MGSHQPVVTDQILDLIANKSEEQRANRQMSSEVVQALKDCGFYTMMLPKRWGARSSDLRSSFGSRFGSPKPI